MGVPWDSECLQAVNSAKSCLSPTEQMDVQHLLDATFHHTRLKEEFGEFSSYFPALQADNSALRTRQEGLAEVPVTSTLSELLSPLARRKMPVNASELFLTLVASDEGKNLLSARGMSAETCRALQEAVRAKAPKRNLSKGQWRTSAQRQQVFKSLAPYGKVLTETAPPSRGTADMEKSLDALYMILVKPKRHNVIITGYPGTGKTRLVYEFARRLVNQHPSVPEVLLDRDIFELVPAWLRAGAGVFGEIDNRIRTLIEILEQNPNIILFVDEIHSFLQSSMHTTSDPMMVGQESLKGTLGRGGITCIGCTTVAQYKHFFAPDEALLRRFDRVHVDPPSRESTICILKMRCPKVEEHFGNLLIPDEIVERTVDLADRFLTQRYQPDKSIQLLDQACAYMVTHKRGEESEQKIEMTEDVLVRALELTLGRKAIGEESLTQEEIFNCLQDQIRGQDDVLEKIASALVTGMSKLRDERGPRSVFLFGGPTGVGKTRVASLLAETLFGHADALIRIDCNTLQGHPSDAGRTQNLLLGTPPGYLGYVRGQGGLLSRIREWPRAVVLFDEFEKAGHAVGEILLRLLDEGILEDVEGNELDFRQSYVIFTTNVGCHRESTMGFDTAASEESDISVSTESVQRELMARTGLGPEFIARIRNIFLFRPLDRDAIRDVMLLELDRLAGRLKEQGYNLVFDENPEENPRKKHDFVDYLVQQWHPHFGVRHALTILDNRLTEQLCIADVQGLLDGASNIKLKFERSADVPGGALLRLEGNTLEVLLR